jgi:hypothetical protein
VAWIVIGVFVHSWEGFLGAVWLFLAAGQLYYARQFRRRDLLGQAPPGAEEDVAALVHQGRKIEAIKRYRQLNPGVGLREAKQVIDGLPAGLNEPGRS